ncbi:MAG: hypothetical protein P8170_19665, partial [Gemmatimonadota bacterium]
MREAHRLPGLIRLSSGLLCQEMPNPGLIERLKRARVVQVLVVYLGASWLILQLADVLQEAVGLPAWVSGFSVLLLLIGLVVVLATAWVQAKPGTTARERAGEIPTDWEIAPADVVASLRRGKLPHLTWARALFGGVLALSLLFAGAGVYVLLTGERALFSPAGLAADEAATGIAVLPFSATGEGMELWHEGMMDLLSTALDGVGSFRTIDSRTVMARWREALNHSQVATLEQALTVAGRTGARYGLVGNAVALGRDVRLSADVYDLTNGSKVAQGAAEGSADSVLAVADDLGLSVLQELLATSGTQLVAPQRISAITTSSLEAMRAFLQGEKAFRSGDLAEAVRRYEEAVGADSTFAVALYRL